MRRRFRLRLSIFIVLVIATALVVSVVLRQKAPPEAARLLPEADAIVYFDLKPVRTITHFDRTPVQRDAEYQKFVDATGFVFERDLDEAAFAIHRMPDPNGPNGPVAFSEVFEGRFDGKRLMQYLATIASAKESYAGHDIYSIPVDGRTVRVAMLGYDLVAASNMPTPEQIHSMLDRYHTAALPFSGSTLLAEQYPSVPLLSEAWGIGRIGLPFGHNGHLQVLGLELPVPADTTFVASLRYVGSLHLRVEELAPTEASAENSVESLRTFLSIYKMVDRVQAANTPADVQFREMAASIHVEQHKERAIITATVPLDLLRKTLAAAPANDGPSNPAP